MQLNGPAGQDCKAGPAGGGGSPLEDQDRRTGGPWGTQDPFPRQGPHALPPPHTQSGEPSVRVQGKLTMGSGTWALGGQVCAEGPPEVVVVSPGTLRSWGAGQVGTGPETPHWCGDRVEVRGWGLGWGLQRPVLWELGVGLGSWHLVPGSSWSACPCLGCLPTDLH